MTATPSPQDVQAKIAAAIAHLTRTDNGYREMVKKNGADPTKWGAHTQWREALDTLAAASVQAGQLLAPVPQPEPQPEPTPTGSRLLGIYDAENAPYHYADTWDAAKAAIPGLTFSMAPMDSSVITHIGTDRQCVQVGAGRSEAQFVQYGLPCWQTGLVDVFMLIDEPGTDTASLAKLKMIHDYVKAHCTGTNKQGGTVRTATTHWNYGAFPTLAATGLIDVLIIDNYPSSSGWDFAEWDKCVAACDTAVAAGQIEEYWIALDAFDAPPQFPTPTKDQLLAMITRAQASKATRLVVYTWGPATGGTPLAQLPDLIAALNTIQ